MNAPVKASSTIPFDAARLDRLMDEAGMDVLVATSKHNVQYLLGGHRAFFFDYMDAMGLSRYLPVMVYAKGAPDSALPASTGRNDSSAPMPRVLMPAERICSIAFCMVSIEPDELHCCTGVQNGWFSR